jgi:hypothetical protein
MGVMSRKKVKDKSRVLTLSRARRTEVQENFSYLASVEAAPWTSALRCAEAYSRSSAVRNLESFGVCGRKKRASTP